MLLLLAPACGGSGSGAGPADEDEHVAPLEAVTIRTEAQTHLLGRGDVAVVPLPPFTVHEDVVVSDVRVETVSGSAELLAARFALSPPKPGCTAVWPLPPTASQTEAAGMRIAKGIAPAMVLYVRGECAVIDSIVVRYAHEDEQTELRWNAVRIELKPRPSGRPSTCTR